MPEDSTLAQNVLSSSIGGITTAFLMTPLDVIKIRMQASTRINHNQSCFIYCNGLMDHLCTCSSFNSKSATEWFKRPIKNLPLTGNFSTFSSSPCNNSMACLVHSPRFITPQSGSFLNSFISLLRNEGPLSLWSGLSPTLAMALPGTIIYYTAQDYIKNATGYSAWLIKRHNSQETSTTEWSPYYALPMLAGGLARVLAVMTISPIELVRTKMQSKQHRLVDMANIVRESARSSGIKSLWMGAGPTLLRDVPYSMIFWCIIEFGRSLALTRKKERTHDKVTSANLKFSEIFSIGVVAGFISGVCTHPFDVIKTHRQIELGESIINNKPFDRSTWHSLKQLYYLKGVSALFSGFTPRLIKTSSASAVMIATYETVKSHL